MVVLEGYPNSVDCPGVAPNIYYQTSGSCIQVPGGYSSLQQCQGDNVQSKIWISSACQGQTLVNIRVGNGECVDTVNQSGKWYCVGGAMYTTPILPVVVVLALLMFVI